MFGIHDFLIFLMAGVTLNVLPGPDTLYIIGRSVAQGRSAGFLSVLGISSGVLVHTTAAALGLSAILMTSALAFSVVKWAGAVYLVYLGLQLIISKGPETAARSDTGEGTAAPWTIYRQGLFTNVLNPKVALFFMAFLPQFVAREQATNPLPYLFLGGVFVCTGTLWCLFLVVIAARVSAALRTGAGSLRTARWITGVVFMGLGIRLALQGQR